MLWSATTAALASHLCRNNRCCSYAYAAHLQALPSHVSIKIPRCTAGARIPGVYCSTELTLCWAPDLWWETICLVNCSAYPASPAAAQAVESCHAAILWCHQLQGKALEYASRGMPSINCTQVQCCLDREAGFRDVMQGAGKDAPCTCTVPGAIGATSG
jgi:hypothetical protein